MTASTSTAGTATAATLGRSSVARLVAPVRRLPATTVEAIVVILVAVACAPIVFMIADRVRPSTTAGAAYVFAIVFTVAFAGTLLTRAALRRTGSVFVLGRGGTTRAALRGFLGELTTSSDLARLVRRALEVVSTDLELERAALFLVPPDGDDFVLADVRGTRPAIDRLERDHPLVELLAALHVELARRTADTDDRYAHVRAACVDAFDALGADMLLPLEAGDRLIGVLALGRGRGGRPLTGGDVELLRALCVELALCAMRADDAHRLHRTRVELERFARFLSPTVAADVLAGTLPGEHGRRRSVSVMVCELRMGAPVEDIEPDELEALLGRLHALAVEQIGREGGTLAQLRGGRIVAVFGDPETMADHAHRALRTATRLTAAIDGAKLTAAEPAGACVGVASGTATAGFIAVGSDVEYEVVGDVARVASLLSARAAQGEVLAAATTVEAARTGVDYVPVALDGLASENPVRVLAVDGLDRKTAAD